MRSYLTAMCFFLTCITVLTVIAAPDVSAERIDCIINSSNPDPSLYTRIDNVTTQGHYSGGTIFHLFCSRNWDRSAGNVSFRFVDPGHVQDPDYNTFPNDEKLGREVVSCDYETGGTPGECSDDSDICAFTMSGDQNAHIADCDQDKLPPSTSYKGTLCCTVRELCYDGKDNDGDGLVDCADPECNGANANTNLEPFSDSGPEVCHPPSSCPQTVHVGLEAYYQFENSTNDSTTNENDISTTSGVTYTSNQIRGKLGQSLKLDPGDSATISDDTSFDQTLDPEDHITVGAFINPDTVSDGTILQKGSAYRLYLSSGRAYFEFQTSSSNTLDLGPVSSGTWTHLTATYNSSANSATGYADGTATDSLTPSGTIPDSASNISLGTGTASNYDGRLDEVRIYSRELSLTEVSSFTNPECQNRQRTIECLNNPELCDTNYPSASNSSYFCSFGQYDDPQNTGYSNSSVQGTGLCCPKGKRAEYDSTFGWQCVNTDECGISSGNPCEYDIGSNESAWLNSVSNGTADACNSQVNRLKEDLTETTRPEGSQACCYVPKNGVTDYWYKDGNVEIYG